MDNDNAWLLPPLRASSLLLLGDQRGDNRDGPLKRRGNSCFAYLSLFLVLWIVLFVSGVVGDVAVHDGVVLHVVVVVVICGQKIQVVL